MKYKEVLVCRVIGELLNPQGSHCQGSRYLRYFVKTVLGRDFSQSVLERLKVDLEYVIPGSDRRMDLVIHSANDRVFFPIEVKVYAGDQPLQCRDYVAYAKKRTTDAQLYYLTLDGRLPGQGSVGDLRPIIKNGMITGYEDIRIISFGQHIKDWLTECLEDKETKKRIPIHEMIRQFRQSICELTDGVKDMEKKRIAELLQSSEIYMETAMKIEQSLTDAKLNVLHKVLTALDERLDAEFCQKYGLSRGVGDSYIRNWYVYPEQIDSFYCKSESSYPGINFLCERAELGNGLELWFRIEVDYALFAGFCVFDVGQGRQYDRCDTKMREKIRACFQEDTCFNEEYWWHLWDYLQVNEAGEFPNFKEMNQTARSLCDEETFVKKIDCMMRKVEELLRYMR